MEALLKKIKECCIEAGNKILTIYNQPFESLLKTDHSPVTKADLISHEFISSFLSTLDPVLPVLSEESIDKTLWDERKYWKEFWLIDPLDGTKEFIKKNGEFTINIALIREGKPILGTVYAPAQKLLYFAAVGFGSFKQYDDKKLHPIKVIKHSRNSKWEIVASRSHLSPKLDLLLSHFKNYNLTNIGSSLKLCLVAEGKAHLYPRLSPTSEWDTAAAHCIVEQAGGFVVNLNLDPLRYNQKNSLLNPYFLAAASLDDLNFLNSLNLD